MKKGFTLLELVVVIVIIGVLATLGIATYTRMIERARGAEGRQVLGAIRTQVAAMYIGNNNAIPVPMTTLNDMVGIGTNAGQISSVCSNVGSGPQYYFSYTAARTSATELTATATRCTGANGKQPGGPAALTLQLYSNFGTGVDTWGGTGGY